MITQARLKELLDYDLATGCFIWKEGVERCGRRKGGSRAGHIYDKTGRNAGYRKIRLDGRRYLEHRLAFLYVVGRWPINQVDHINLDKSDNRWENLREATQSQNRQNTGARKNSTSGFKNVHFHKRDNKFHARVTIDGKRTFLGYCDSAEDAFALVVAATGKYLGEFGRAA